MSKLYFEINGGLGNQLFQVATAYAFAKKFKCKIILDTRGCDAGTNFHSSWQLQKFSELLEKDINCKVRRSNSVLKRLKRKFNDLIYKKIYIDKSSVEKYFQKKQLEKKNYFFPVTESRNLASEAINSGFDEQIEKLKEHIGRNNLIASQGEKSIAIHLRRNDRKNTEYEIPDSWFISQIKEIEEKIEHIYCFTDSKSEASFLSDIGIPTTILGEELEPLIALLSLSDFKKIYISNSTFSFWASALGVDKTVTSPLGFHHPLRPLRHYIFKEVIV